jgi:hypothetical protein
MQLPDESAIKNAVDGGGVLPPPLFALSKSPGVTPLWHLQSWCRVETEPSTFF